MIPISVFAIPGLLDIECGMPQHIGAGGVAPKVTVRIDASLKKKCPRTALACVTARVEAAASPAALLVEMKMRENEIQKLPFPRGVLASSEVEATRADYKTREKDPARCCGAEETLFS